MKKHKKDKREDDHMDIDDVHIKVEEHDNVAKKIKLETKEEEEEAHKVDYEKSDAEKLLDFEFGAKNAQKIAEPLATYKLHKQILKLIKKGFKAKSCYIGTKIIVKAIRKNKKGYFIIIYFIIVIINLLVYVSWLEIYHPLISFHTFQLYVKKMTSLIFIFQQKK